jgi:hypothetical protein
MEVGMSRINLETLSIRTLEKKLAQSACGSAEERAIRSELLRRELDTPLPDNGTLPMDYEGKRQEMRSSGLEI